MSMRAHTIFTIFVNYPSSEINTSTTAIGNPKDKNESRDLGDERHEI